jgi:hypothetical protein
MLEINCNKSLLHSLISNFLFFSIHSSPVSLCFSKIIKCFTRIYQSFICFCYTDLETRVKSLLRIKQYESKTRAGTFWIVPFWKHNESNPI